MKVERALEGRNADVAHLHQLHYLLHQIDHKQTLHHYRKDSAGQGCELGAPLVHDAKRVSK